MSKNAIFDALLFCSYDAFMRVGIYARVPTHNQQTLLMQLKQMKEYIRNRDWKLAIEVQEIGSGAETRPRREELLGMARRREIDAVLVWKLHRFGRSLADLITNLNELRDIGVTFISLPELTSPRKKIPIQNRGSRVILTL